MQNAVGKLGLMLSHIFVYKIFGLPAISMSLLFAVISLKIIGVKKFNYGKIISDILFYTLWLSITLSFFEDSNSYILGGKIGDSLGNWLISIFGKFITALILISVLFLYAYYTFELFHNFAVKTVTDVKNKKKIGDILKKKNKTTTNEEPTTTSIPTDKDEDPITTEFEITNTDDDKVTENINYTLSDNGAKINPDSDDFEVHNTSNEDDSEDDEDEASPFQLQNTPPAPEHPLYNNLQLTVNSNEEILMEHIDDKPKINFDPKLDLSNYKTPSIEMLVKRSSKFEINNAELLRNKKKIVSTLKDYKIEITKIKATVGPTITLYEIVPKAGVRISKIKNLEDDIALSLAALGIRIIAPMPGRGTIGIEVPNQNPQIVSLRSVIRSKKFQESDMELPIALGKTISNEAYVFDLTKMPHLLVAGATGQGKSVGLNVLISSILYKKHPAEVKFVIVDPKKVEMTQFEKLNKHFLATLPNNDSDELIVTDNQKVLETIKALNIEMDNRYQILKKAGARNIKEYNKKFTERKLNPEKGHKYLPYIVLVIDEFADLIMTAGKEIEQPIARLAQLARAIGIHLIVATQRPSTNIITGAIKANFPGRIAFRVASMIDSRTIIDSPGANRLIGRGDMLITKGNDLIRLQCAFVDTPELDKITDYIEQQQGYTMPYYLPEPESDEDGGAGGGLEEKDELFNEAARIILYNQQGSTSLLQRKMSIGYNRAGRIMDQLERARIVGPGKGSKPRDVLIQDEYALEEILNNIP